MPRRRVHRATEKIDQARDNLIQLLKKENKALKSRNKDLTRQPSKKHVCPICRRSYTRSDGLYRYLNDGDNEYKYLADERYSRRCRIYEKECIRWGDLTKYMAVYQQKPTGSAGDLILFLVLLKGANTKSSYNSGVPFPESRFSCV